MPYVYGPTIKVIIIIIIIIVIIIVRSLTKTNTYA